MSAVLATAPALPLHTAGPYVAAAYIVFVVLLLVYLAIMATRLGHTERELSELRRDVEEGRRRAGDGGSGGPGDPDGPDKSDPTHPGSERERERVA